MTCTVVGCDQPVHIQKRQLCKPHYGKLWRMGAFGSRRTGVSHRWHRISDVDPEGMTATCTRCGPEIAVYHHPTTKRYGCIASARRSTRKWLRGMDEDAYLYLLASAGESCEICLRDVNVPGEPACIDHDHACCPDTGGCARCVRGVLCRRCNTGIGMFLDSEDHLLAAIEYLRERRVDPNLLPLRQG